MIAAELAFGENGSFSRALPVLTQEPGTAG
jgi:hypothetical protein